MIRKLQIRITVLITTILSLVTVGILVAVNIVQFRASQQAAFDYLNAVATSEGQKTDLERDPSFASYRFFSVLVDAYGNVFKYSSNDNALYTNDELASMTTEVLRRGDTVGAIDHAIYAVKDTLYGRIIVFMDNRITENNIRTVRFYSVIFGGMSMLVIFSLSVMLARRLTKPVEEAFQKQKRFLSDAGHELKTPLAVITANADVLESEIGENKWLSYIKNEAFKMSSLVGSMLTLTRIESAETGPVFGRFDLSETVRGAVMPFESIAYEKQVELAVSIPDGITINGNEEQLSRVAAILTDNAVKYTEPGGRITVSLRQGKHKTILEVANTGAEIPTESREKIFDRFYRADRARTRETGSYGLGLSIAKTVVSLHHGNIEVDCRGGWVIFTVVL